MIELGGNVVLSGFREVDPVTLIAAKKIVGNHMKTLTLHLGEKFRKITITLKPVHKRETSQKYELNVHLSADRDYHAEFVDRNLLTAVDTVLRKIQAELGDK